MKTLQEDIDDLDRMVDAGAAKDAIRSQIRLISREVAALEADYASVNQAHSQLQSGLEERISGLQERDKQALRKDNMGWSGWEKFRNLTPNDKTNLQEQE